MQYRGNCEKRDLVSQNLRTKTCDLLSLMYRWRAVLSAQVADPRVHKELSLTRFIVRESSLRRSGSAAFKLRELSTLTCITNTLRTCTIMHSKGSCSHVVYCLASNPQGLLFNIIADEYQKVFDSCCLSISSKYDLIIPG